MVFPYTLAKEQQINDIVLKFYKKTDSTIILKGETMKPLIIDDLLVYKEPIIQLKDWYTKEEFEELKSFFASDHQIYQIEFP